MAQRVYARPIIPLLMGLIGGILVGTWLGGHAVWVSFFVLLCAGLIFARIRKKQMAMWLPILLLGGLGYLAVQPWVAPGFPEHHIIHRAGARKLIVTAVVKEAPIPFKRGIRCILETQTVQDLPAKEHTPLPVTGRMRITLVGNITDLTPGDRITFAAKIKRIRRFNNPGGFDYEKYMAFKRIWVSAYVPERRLLAVRKGYASRDFLRIESTRQKIARLIDASSQAAPNGVLKALVIGSRGGITPAMRAEFNRSGVGHLLAISGLHIGIVAGVCFFVVVRLLAYIRPLLWRAWTRKGAAILALFMVVLYGLLAGMSASTQRAVIMVAVFLLSFLIEREHDLLNTLAIAALIILCIHPPALFSISFQLSFAAVTGILYGLAHFKPLPEPLAVGQRKTWYANLFLRMITIAGVSMLAILATLPVLMYYFNQISLIGVAANIIIVPVVGFLVVPLALLSALAGLVFLPLGQTGIKLCAQILTPTLDLVRFFSDLPLAAIKTFTPNILEIGLYYGFAWVLLKIIPKDDPLSRSGRANTLPKRWAWVLMGLVLLVGAIDTGYWLQYRWGHKYLRMTVLDVGQGSAVLLELPRGKNMLIDGGGFSDNAVFDMGARVVAPFLWRQKIMTIDTLVLSHPNSDHLNGLLYIAEHFNVKQVWTNGETPNTQSFNKFKEIITRKGIDAPSFQGLARDRRINGVRLEILYPPADSALRRGSEKWRSGNNSSLVIKVTLGATTILIPGDIMARAEKELVTTAASRLPSTVLLAPHHGSRTSSTAAFVDAVIPKIVVVSSGMRDSPNFPHKSVMKRYHQKDCRILRTDQNGAVRIISNGKEIEVIPTKGKL